MRRSNRRRRGTRRGLRPFWRGAHTIQPSLAADEEPEITKRLRAQYAEISQLAGGLAHEIRNPLSTLSLNLDLLAEDFQDAETPRDRRVLKRVERLQHEVQRLYGIVENFLRFARVQDLKLEPTDVNEVVDELRDFYEPNAASRGIVIRTQFASRLAPGSDRCRPVQAGPLEPGAQRRSCHALRRRAHPDDPARGALDCT